MPGMRALAVRRVNDERVAPSGSCHDLGQFLPRCVVDAGVIFGDEPFHLRRLQQVARNAAAKFDEGALFKLADSFCADAQCMSDEGAAAIDARVALTFVQGHDILECAEAHLRQVVIA